MTGFIADVHKPLWWIVADLPMEPNYYFCKTFKINPVYRKPHFMEHIHPFLSIRLLLGDDNIHHSASLTYSQER